MTGYFSFFPKIEYDANCGESGTNPAMIAATDITRRFRLLPSILSRAVLFYTYWVRDDERPDIVAEKFYHNSKLDWLVLMTNQVADPLWKWPLGYNHLMSYIQTKYGSADAALRGEHHYEQILQEASEQDDGTPIPEQAIVIDYATFLSLPSTETRSVSYFEWEIAQNDLKREIKIIRPEYLAQIISEATNVLSRSL